MKGKIRVYCRVRPMSKNELDNGYLNIVTIVNQFTVKIKLKKENMAITDGKQGYEEKEF
jgi:hypothetical protein